MKPIRSPKLARLLESDLGPFRFLAAQLRRPSGPFGRMVMTRVLDRGNAELIGGAVEALSLGQDDRYLDLGFGGGLSIRLASERTRGALWGVDFSPDVVVAGQRTFADLIAAGRLNLLCGDVADLPLRDGLVTAVATTNTIYFWPDPAAGFASLRRVLAPGGRLAVGFSGAEKMRGFGEITRHGFRLFEPDEVTALLEASGFANVRVIPQRGRVSQGDFVAVGSVAERPRAYGDRTDPESTARASGEA